MFALSISPKPNRRRRGADVAYHHGDLRQSLLTTARDLVAEVGIDGFSLREVSRRAGVSHTAAYNHFADRSALVRALAVEAFEALTQATMGAQAAGQSPYERLQAIGVAYVTFAFEHQAEFRFMFRPELCAPALDGDDALKAAGRESYNVLVEAMRDAGAAGAVDGDVEALTLAAWSMVHGLATLLVDGPDRTLATTSAKAATLAHAVTTILLFGMAPPK